MEFYQDFRAQICVCYFYPILTLKILTYYMKFFFIFPNYLLRTLFTSGNKLLDILNNGMNSITSELLPVEPLKLIDKQYDEISKFTLFTFANHKLLDHKYLFVALFSALSLEEEVKQKK